MCFSHTWSHFSFTLLYKKGGGLTELNICPRVTTCFIRVYPQNVMGAACTFASQKLPIYLIVETQNVGNHTTTCVISVHFWIWHWQSWHDVEEDETPCRIRSHHAADKSFQRRRTQKIWNVKSFCNDEVLPLTDKCRDIILPEL